MRINSRKSLALLGAVVITGLLVTPSNAAAPAATGTIHVISKVVNDNLGTDTPSNFIFNVKHWGTDVVGSPFMGADGAGVTFILPVGSYVVSTALVPGYGGSWSGVGIENGHIMLQAGQDVTIIRTSSDVGVFVEPVVETPPTVTGGTLPTTSTPWFNLLAIGLLVSAAGAFGLRKSSIFN